MEALNISKKQFEKLITYDLPCEVLVTECNLYVLKPELTSFENQVMFKRFFVDTGDYFGNKLLTINTLIDNKDLINNEQLVLPERIVVVDERVVGFMMPYIKNNTNLSTVLKNKDIDIKIKKGYLKQIGEILRKMQKVEKYKNNFFLTDLHEGNFIVEDKTKKLYAVDLDSCKIGDNQPSNSRYLSSNTNIKYNIKYPTNSNLMYIPSFDTENLCYVTTILNFLADGPIHKLSKQNYYKYLEYLKENNFSNEILDCFSKIYTNQPNESPENIIDQIPENIENANYKNFLKKIK